MYKGVWYDDTCFRKPNSEHDVLWDTSTTLTIYPAEALTKPAQILGTIHQNNSNYPKNNVSNKGKNTSNTCTNFAVNGWEKTMQS